MLPAWGNLEQKWSQHMISTLHALRKSGGKSCELNYQTDMDYVHDEEDKIYYNFSSGNVIDFSDLETIITSSNMADDRGVSVDRNLRVSASQKVAGSTKYIFQITQIYFSATLFVADGGGYEFNDPSNELATGVTVADFISRLDVEWE